MNGWARAAGSAGRKTAAHVELLLGHEDLLMHPAEDCKQPKGINGAFCPQKSKSLARSFAFCPVRVQAPAACPAP